MITNINNVKESYFQNKLYDVCIIGSGFAGITSALKLNKKLHVLLLEGGALEYTQNSQDIYKGTNTGHTYWDLDGCRARFFGGTSNTWGGWCVPFNKEVFEKKAIKNSEWPIKKSDLDPYLDETYKIFGFKKSVSQEYLKGVKIQKYKFFKSYEILVAEQEYYVNKHKSTISDSNNIECYYNANLVDMRTDKDLNNINHIYVQNYKNKQYKIKSKIFILATGGIENARLMLNFNKDHKLGIGNNNNLVGRYFTEHPHYDTGFFLLDTNTTPFFKNNESTKHVHTTRFFEEKENISSCTIELHNTGTPIEKNYYNQFKEMLRDTICKNNQLQNLISNIRDEKIYCYPDDADSTHGIVRIQSEQQLNYNSTISLNNEKDILGLRRINLNWILNKIDKKTIQKSMLSFGTEFANLDIGRIKVAKWVLTSNEDLPGFPHRIGGPHHMCTTRMGFSERDGVVDLNQKVFGINNLYIAGSSVFSTAASVNPTFTIVQMTLRLTDYLNKEVFHIQDEHTD